MGRRARKSKRSDKISGVALAAIGLAMMVLLGGGGFYVRQLHVALDSETNCPVTGPTAVHLILIDRSDPISPQQAQRVRQWEHLQKAGAVAGTRFDLYAFEGDADHELHPLLSICATEQPANANPLYQNAASIRKRYEAKFADVLDAMIADMLQVSTKPRSPIIESLRAAAQTSFGLLAGNTIPLRITLISDLVQHSPEVSHFRAPADFDSLSRNGDWARLRPELRGADVEILYILRPNALRDAAAIQNRGHQDFWARLIAASGGRVSEFTPF